MEVHGEKGSNEPDASRADPESRLCRKADNTAAGLRFAGHRWADHLNALIVDAELIPGRPPPSGTPPAGCGADDGSGPRRADAEKRGHDTAGPLHVASNATHSRSAVDGRTARDRRTRADSASGSGLDVGGAVLTTPTGAVLTTPTGAVLTTVLSKINRVTASAPRRQECHRSESGSADPGPRRPPWPSAEAVRGVATRRLSTGAVHRDRRVGRRRTATARQRLRCSAIP
jgi:hypothetical protein